MESRMFVSFVTFYDEEDYFARVIIYNFMVAKQWRDLLLSLDF